MSKLIKTVVLFLVILSMGLVIWSYKVSQSNKHTLSIESHITAQMGVCEKKQGRDNCYKRVAENLMTQYSLPEILKVFLRAKFR